MKILRGKLIPTALVLCCCSIATSGQLKSDPFAAVPQAERKDLATRLSDYVRYYKARNWAELYSLVSDVGKDRLDSPTFESIMKREHGGSAYSAMPNLEAFEPAQSRQEGDGIDIYGCAKAKRNAPYPPIEIPLMARFFRPLPMRYFASMSGMNSCRKKSL